MRGLLLFLQAMTVGEVLFLVPLIAIVPVPGKALQISENVAFRPGTPDPWFGVIAMERAEQGTLTGTVTYWERIVLRPETVMEVELLDVSRADIAASRLASIQTRVAGSPPIPFTLHYDPAMIDPRLFYAVSAKLRQNGQVLFRSDTILHVLTRGAPSSVVINVVQARNVTEGVATHDPNGGGKSLVGPVWVAEDIAGRGVLDYLQSSIQFMPDNEVAGFGGCNRFRGRFKLDGSTLEVGPLAGTRKACPEAIMNQETRFYEALDRVRAYRFDKGLLHLLDAGGETAARLWQRK